MVIHNHVFIYPPSELVTRGTGFIKNVTKLLGKTTREIEIYRAGECVEWLKLATALVLNLTSLRAPALHGY
ncbi:hypothetical protein ANTPLA_LOCUS773 [Anthophora plagiata]